MNTTFDINRLGLTLKRYFIENKQRELTFWGITIVVFTLMHLAGSQEKSIAVQMFLYISGFIFAARTFKQFNYTPSGMHYLMIPATQLEKVTTSILLSTFYYFAMIVLTYIIGTALGTTIGNLFFETNNPIYFELFQSSPQYYMQGNEMHTSFNNSSSILNTFITFAGIQSVFMLGSIYFKGNVVGKTILANIGIIVLLTIIELVLLKTIFGSYSIIVLLQRLSMLNGQVSFPEFEIAQTVFAYAIIPFFWVVTYFRLTEKEV